MRLNNFIKLAVAIGVSQLAGIIGSFFTTPSIPIWYMGLEKPLFNPPAWVFGPVWITLFTLMGVAFFIVWNQYSSRVRNMAITLFFSQLALNTVWSIIFFGMKNPGLALIEIIFLWVAILWTMILFGKLSKKATWLMVPYIIWVSFAIYLNYSIWILN